MLSLYIKILENRMLYVPFVLLPLPSLLLNSVSIPLSFSRSSLPLPPSPAPLPLCQRVIQVQFTGGLVKVSFPSHVRVGDFPLCSLSESLDVLSNTDPFCSPCYFLPLFCIKELNLEFLTVSDTACLKDQAKD